MSSQKRAPFAVRDKVRLIKGLALIPAARRMGPPNNSYVCGNV